MNNAIEENNDSQDQSEEQEEIDWEEHGRKLQEEQSLRPLDRTDYLALFIASWQTIFLPLVILIILLISVNFLLQLAVG